MSEYGLCCNHTELFIPFLIALQQHSNGFLTPLHKSEVLLLSELKTRNLVVKDAYVFLHIWVFLVFNHVCLVAKGDASEEFSHNLLVTVVFSRQDHICCLIVILCVEFQFIWEVVESFVNLECVID